MVKNGQNFKKCNHQKFWARRCSYTETGHVLISQFSQFDTFKIFNLFTCTDSAVSILTSDSDQWSGLSGNKKVGLHELCGIIT